MTTAENNNPAKPRIPYDVNKIREDFPIFREPVNGKARTYLDNAATTQKPQAVIDAITGFYTQKCATLARHTLRAALEFRQETVSTE